MAIKKVNSKKAAAKSAIVRSTPKDNRKAVPERTPLRLEYREWWTPQFVVVNGGRYVSNDDMTGKKLNPDVSKAVRSDRSEADELATTLTNKLYPRTWSDPFEVAQLIVTKRGLVTGHTFTLEDEDAPRAMWEMIDRHDAALAAAAAFEQTAHGDEAIFMHGCILGRSPLWKLLTILYQQELAAELAEGDKGDPENALRMNNARVFYAGVCAARSEAGKREPHAGNLVLDSPTMPEDADPPRWNARRIGASK